MRPPSTEDDVDGEDKCMAPMSSTVQHNCTALWLPEQAVRR
jgi:hypothetical protein